MINPDLVVVTGPLSPFQDGFGCWLEEAGYSRAMRAEHLRLMAGLSRWLQERGEAGGCLSRPLLAEFLGGRRGARGSTGRSMAGMRPLMEYLRGAGAAPPDEPEPPSGPPVSALPCATQVRDPVPGIHLSRTRPEFPYHGVSWANASGREGDRDASGLPVRPELIAAPVTRLLGYRPMHGIRFLAYVPGSVRAYHLASAAYQQVSPCVTTSAGIPGPGSGEGIDQSG